LTVEMMILLLLVALAAAGAIIGVAAILRRARRGTQIEANPMSPRVSAEVHAGEEQVLIHVARSLRMPSDRDDVAYGQIYIAGSAGMTLKLASRSEIGRGFDAEVRVHRTRRASLAEYYILRLPGDESLYAEIASLDERIALAFRTLDPEARVHGGGRSALA
jgi:hypothetical protein